MPLHKLESTDAFVITDLPDVPSSGVVRMAKKILQSSATDLARTATYTFATFEIQRSGASGGINAVGDAQGPALEAFIGELLPEAEAGVIHLDEAKGVPDDAFAPLDAAAGRHALGGSARSVAMSVLAATTATLGGLSGARVAIEGGGDVPTALREALTEAGAEIVDVDGVDAKPWLIWGADADAVLAGSKLGALTHQGTEFVKAKAIVPWGPVPVTTKAFAQLRQADVTVVPDFVSAAGGLLADHVEGATDDERLAAIASLVTDRLTGLLAHDDGPLLGACYDAEAYLASWTDTKLFGRPLA